MTNKPGKRANETEKETEKETKDARESAPAKPSPSTQGTPPWTAYAVVGSLIALIA